MNPLPIIPALIALQSVYLLAGITMNLISLRRVQRGLPALTTMQPQKGLLSMLLGILLTASVLVLPAVVYVFAWAAFAAGIINSAVLPHCHAVASGVGIERYASRPTAYWALSINMFGLGTCIFTFFLALRWVMT